MVLCDERTEAIFPIQHVKISGSTRILTKIIKQALCTTILGVVGFSGTKSFAAEECGAPDINNVVICDNTSLNPYIDGITYDNYAGTSDFQLRIKSGIIIHRTPEPDNSLDYDVNGDLINPRVPGHNGVQVMDASGHNLAVYIDNGVVITTEGLHADGVEVYGSGNVTIDSGANITTIARISDFRGTSGLFGWISDTDSHGNISISQRANSTITVYDEDGFGLFGLNYGTGSVVLESSGNVDTYGYNGFGLNAWNITSGGADTTVILHESGRVTTAGEVAAGLYSLNEGTGDALVYAHGHVTTTGKDADAIVSDIDNQYSEGDAKVELTGSAVISTSGVEADGVWALNWGLGDASVISAASISTTGEKAHGIRSEIRYEADPTKGHYRDDASVSNANVYIVLEENGTVTTTKNAAHGLYAINNGTGGAFVTMGSQNFVSTNGELSNGVEGDSWGTLSFIQDRGGIVTVTGRQAFGVNLVGTSTTDAEISGTVSSTGEYGVGISSFSEEDVSTVLIDTGVTITGGWQADVASVGDDTERPSAGVLIGSSISSQLTNRGAIVAGSDRAIVGITNGEFAGGDLTIDNTGVVTGFVELLGGGTNTFNNEAGGEFVVRHFAKTERNGERDTKRVSISDFGGLDSIFNNNSGGIVRLGAVPGLVTADAAGYYIPTSGVNSDPLEGSYYNLARADVVQGQFTNLGIFNHSGVLDLRGAATGNTLVITGAESVGLGEPGTGVFVSNGGVLLLNTYFNEGVAVDAPTGSYSDVLIVDGTELGEGGPTTITIDRREGPGALTPGNGILLVEVRDKTASADDVFTLNGDYTVNGEQVVVGGAHRYSLYHNGVEGDEEDGNWYLRNLGIAPTVPIYEDYPKVLIPLIDVPTLQQRVGNRYWNEPASRPAQTVFCKDPSQNYQCVVTPEQSSYYRSNETTTTIEASGIWGRIKGAHGHYQPAVSSSGAEYDTNLFQMQAGLDGLLAEYDSGKLIGGITLHYGHVSADILSSGSDGNIKSDGYGIGGTLTWYGTNGFYSDAQAQATWLNSDIHSDTIGTRLIDGNKGFGYALSLEIGQRIDLKNHWSVLPQAQLTYTNVRFDTFTDTFGATVELLDGDSLRGRLGLAAEHQSSWKEDDNTISRASGYGVVNLYNEFLNGTRVDVSGIELSSRNDRLWAGVGLGGTYNWDDDKYSVYGEVSANTSLKDFGNSYELGGTLGLRVKW